MKKNRSNLFARMPSAKNRENFTPLLKSEKIFLERIVSKGQTTPKGKWLKQSKREWVLVLRGKAKLRFSGRRGLLTLGPGDYVFIAAKTLHRVEWTDPKHETVWLALHF